MAPNDGIVTMLTINTASPYDVRDQYGSGSSDYPEKVITWLREVAPAVDVPVVGTVWWAAPIPAPEVCHQRSMKDNDVMSDGDLSTTATSVPSWTYSVEEYEEEEEEEETSHCAFGADMCILVSAAN